MSGIMLSKETLSVYLYNVGALEVARQQEIEKQQESREILQNNESVIHNMKEPEQPVYEEAEKPYSLIERILICVMFAIIPGVITYVIFIPLSWLFNFSRLFPAIVVACIGLGVGIMLVTDKSTEKRRIENNERLKAQYEQDVAEYQWNIDTEQKVRLELEAKIQEGQAKIDKINDELKRQYSLGILHSQYQTMEAVLVMHNLLVTGRCDTLKEALNAYEDFAWKKNDVQWKQAVLQQLTNICTNQRELICSIDALNTQTATIAKLTQQGFKDLQGSMEEIRMQGEIIAGNTRTIALLQTFDFWQTHVVND